MKQFGQNLLKLLFVALVFTLPSKALAYDFMVDSICYNITSEAELTCAVTYYDMYYNMTGEHYNSDGTHYKGDIVIPESVTYDDVTYKVNSIEGNTFRDCSGLIRVEIPSSVTTIGNSAFGGCI